MIFHQQLNSMSGNKFNIRRYRDEGWEFHFHKNFELIYVIEGAVLCTINGKSEILEKGSFGLCLSNEIHAYKPEPGGYYWVLVFSEDLIPSFSNSVKGMEGKSFVFKPDEDVCRYLEKRLIENKKPSLYTLKSCLYAVCDEYLKSTELSEKSMKRDSVASVITDFVSANYKKDIKLSDVASVSGLDYHYLSRYFHKMFNMSFRDYLNSYRLEDALYLLENSDKKLSDIAFECGFQSIRSFNACFKERFLKTPSKYRKCDKVKNS